MIWSGIGPSPKLAVLTFVLNAGAEHCTQVAGSRPAETVLVSGIWLRLALSPHIPDGDAPPNDSGHWPRTHPWAAHKPAPEFREGGVVSRTSNCTEYTYSEALSVVGHVAALQAI